MTTRRTAKKNAAQAQAATNAVNRYDAAGMGRRMRGWNPPASGPNKAIAGLQTIRNRSHDAVRNDWSGTSGVRNWTTNLVGTGIVPRMRQITDKAKKARYTKALRDWSKKCDADCMLDMFGQQTLVTRSWFTAGEVFGRLRYRRADSGLIVPMQVQVIESEYVPMLDADTWPGMPMGNRIRSGIELDRIGQRVAAWIYREHPGDNQGRTSIDQTKLIRVPWAQMLHVYEVLRPGQLRGVPDFAPILARLRNVSDFDDAVLERQKLANLIAAFVERPVNTGVDDGVDPLTGQPIQTDGMGRPVVAWEPGMVQELEPGEKMNFSNPPEAGTTYSDYMRTQNLGISAGQGLPYELQSGDIKNTSDRTLRVIMNEFRRFCQQRQWQVLIPMWCQRVHDAWVDSAVLAGVVSSRDSEAVKAVDWQPQGWAYIHPVQDVQAKALEVQNGFRSRSSVIAERGDDPWDVDEEIAADHAREDELGIEIGPSDLAQQQQGDQQTNDPQKGSKPTARALDNLVTTVARLESFVHAKATEPRAEPQSFIINNHIPPTQVHNTVAVEPTPVTVQNTVEPTPVNVQTTVAAPTVNVAQPTVNVAAPTVNVAAPVLNVTNEVPPAEVTVNLPDRETNSTVKRDSDGNIIRVTQVEKTILQ